MNVKQITFTKPRTVELCDIELPDELLENQVLIKTAYTTISCGTEKANLIGELSTNCSEDKKTTYPCSLGYNCSGIVVAKGSKVESLEIGDRVVGYGSNHRSYNLLIENQVIKIPYENVSLQIGAMSYIATFPMAA